MDILNKKIDKLLNLLNYYLLKIGKKLEKGILSIRYKIIQIFNKIKIFKKLNINKLVFIKELILKNIKIILISGVVLITIFCFFAFNKNYYHTFLFYPDRNKSILLAEKREIIKKSNKIRKIKNIIEELLLGPIDSNLYNIFPKESKLLSAILINKDLLLNFNKETIMNIQNESEDNNLIYSLLLKSIVNSICFQVKDIELVKFYFEGKEYKYLGSYGPIDKGIKPDWNMLK